MPLKAVIVDDEPLALDLLEAMLQDYPEVHISAKCSNGYDAIEAVLHHAPDILFLDIEMPEITGFDVIRAIQGDIMPKVIFTTAYSQYAVEAFKVQALNYVLKPLDDDKIRDSLSRAKEALGRSELESKSKMLSAIHGINENQSIITQRPNTSLVVKDADKVSFLDKADLKWVEADGDYVCIHMTDKTHLIRATLKSIEDQLLDVNFQRIHRSTIINLDKVKEIRPVQKGEAIVIMSTGQQLKASRSYGAALRAKIA